MSAFWKNGLIGAFLLGFIGLLGSFNASKPRILVLHAFDQDYSWVRTVDLGIREALKNNRRPVSVQWHYLGFNRKPHADQREDAAIQARRAITQIDPDILIAVDDESSAHVARHYVGRDRPRILFVSIDQPLEQYGYRGARNVSGIAEQLPLAAVRDALLTMRSDQSARIAVLGAHDDTGRAELAQTQAFDWTPHRLVATEVVKDFTAWQAFVERTASQADALLVLSYGGLERGGDDHQVVAGAEMVNWVETNAKPLPLGIQASYVEDGGGLSFSPPPFDYGQKAMELALAWLEAPSGAAAPPVTTSAHFRVSLRPTRLATRGVKLPAIYVEAARIGESYFP